MEEQDFWDSEGHRSGTHADAEGSTEDMAGEQIQQPSSDSSSDSDYDVQLARKIKQRSSYQGSEPGSFPSSSAAVLVSAACEMPTPQLVRHSSNAVASEDHPDADAAKLGTSMPINIPALAGRMVAAADANDHIHGATFVPPHLIEQQKEARLCATGVSMTGMSPSTSLKRDRLLQRNAILRRTGFIEAGAAHKGFAEVLDPIKESRPFEMPGGGGLSMALGSTPDSSGLVGSLKEKHSSALSQALGTSPSQQ